MRIRAVAVLAALSLTSLATACGSSGTTVRFGYSPDLTQAPAIIGVADGILAKQLGKDKLTATAITLESTSVDQLVAGTLDVAVLGPNEALEAFSKSKGEVRILSGMANGGSFLITKPSIQKAGDLVGKTIATASEGGTQDVAFRTWLRSLGVVADAKESDKVKIVQSPPADTLADFKSGQIDGAWLTEPWATHLQVEGKGRVAAQESDLWSNGSYTTSVVVARKAFADKYPDTIYRFMRGVIASIDYVHGQQGQAQATVAKQIEELSGQAVPASQIATAWTHMTYTWNPHGLTISDDLSNASLAGFLTLFPLKTVFDLTRLNAVLKAKKYAQVSAQA